MGHLNNVSIIFKSSVFWIWNYVSLSNIFNDVSFLSKTSIIWTFKHFGPLNDVFILFKRSVCLYYLTCTRCLAYNWKFVCWIFVMNNYVPIMCHIFYIHVHYEWKMFMKYLVFKFIWVYIFTYFHEKYNCCCHEKYV